MPFVDEDSAVLSGGNMPFLDSVNNTLYHLRKELLLTTLPLLREGNVVKFQLIAAPAVEMPDRDSG